MVQGQGGQGGSEITNHSDGTVESGGFVVQTGSIRDINATVHTGHDRSTYKYVSREFHELPEFAGRDEQLQELETAFADAQPRRPVVRFVNGPRGIGKSAVARVYGDARQLDYDLLVWIEANDSTRVDEQCRRLLRHLDPAGVDAHEPLDVVHGILANRRNRWLLVLDGLPYTGEARRRIPAAGPGNVIVTSRSPEWPERRSITLAPIVPEAPAAVVVAAAPTESRPVYTPVVRARRGALAAVSSRLFAVDYRKRLVEVQYYSDTDAHELDWWPLDEPEGLRRIAASSLRPGHHEVFGLTGDGGLLHRWYEGDPGEWSGWRVLATPGQVSALAAGSCSEGYQDLFVACTDGSVRTRHFPDGRHADWSSWEAVDAPSKIKDMAISTMDRKYGHREVFAVTHGGRILHRWNHRDNGSPWSDWAVLETPGTVQTIAVGSPRPGHQVVFAALEDGRVFKRTYLPDVWRDDWEPVSFYKPIVALATSSIAPGHLELFAAARDGSLHRV